MPSRRQVSRGLILLAGLALAPALRSDLSNAGSAMAKPAGETLDENTLSVLLVTARTITALPVLYGPYADYYAYQAEKRPGRMDIYKAFATAVRRDMGRTASDFAALAESERSALIRRIRQSAAGWAFETAIFRETLALFAKTDAWLLLGYDAWPGQARGLESYRLPLSNRGVS